MKKIFLALCLCLVLCGCGNDQEVYDNTGGVVYEIFVASFNDSNGDKVGDLNGIVQKLEYLEYLGVEQLWLMPIHPSSSYHKYDVEDYYAIDKAYGTMEDFENLIVEAEKHDISIIMDLVLNHSSNRNNWFIHASADAQLGKCALEDAKCDWYHFTDTTKPGYTRINSNLYYESVFSSNMPDLNLDNQEVRDEIAKIVKFYLDKGVKGFRLDAVMHYYEGNIGKNVEFLSWLNQTVKSINPDAYLVGEAWTAHNAVKEYYASGMDSLFDFSLSDTSGTIVKSIRNQNGFDLASIMVSHIEDIHQMNPNGTNAIFLSNHDQGRSASYFTEEAWRKLAASVYLLSPGKPFIYYGEEIGMRGSGIDENKRLAMLWGEDNDCNSPIGNNYASQIDTSVKEQMSDKESLWSHYHEVLNIRNRNAFLTNAKAKVYDFGNASLFGMIAYDEEREIVVIHNFSSEVVEFDVDEAYVLQSSLDSKNKVKKGSGSIQPYSTIVLEKE